MSKFAALGPLLTTGTAATAGAGATSGLLGSAGVFSASTAATSALVIGGTALSVSGDLKDASFQESLGEQQAFLANQTAEMNLANARIDAALADRRRALALGSAAARTGGTKGGIGTNLLVSKDIDAQGSLEREIILSGARTSAFNTRSAGAIAKASAKNRARSSRNRAASRVLKGVGSAFGLGS